MIRCNKNMKGITIREKEILLALFADDTTLFLDGSEKSFTEAIATLELFSKISGLKINNEKTQISWIGRSRNCKVEYLRDRNFIWDPGTFKTLGITFSTNIEEISHLNFNGKIDDVKREIARWKKRHLTPLGRITIIKTLIIPKLTYLFINIPDPNKDFLKEIDKLLLRFLWGGKTNRIKRSTICKSYEEGGIRMLDIFTYLSSMKISWLKRIITARDALWSHFYPILKRISCFGEDYAQFCKNRIKNQFWQHVLNHYITLYRTNQGHNVEPSTIYDEPIHYNENIKRGNQVIYIKEWEERGILKIKDILADDNTSLMSFQDFKNKYNVANADFLLYQGVSEAIKKYLNDVKRHPLLHRKIYASELWDCILAGNKVIKAKLHEEISMPTAVKKWNEIFIDLKWNTIFKNTIKHSSDSQLRWFQIRLIHRILPTKKYLFRCNLTDDPLCSFCGDTDETLSHLFWNCTHVKSFGKT